MYFADVFIHTTKQHNSSKNTKLLLMLWNIVTVSVCSFHQFIIRLFVYFILARQPPVGQGLLINEVSRSYARRITVGRTPLEEWSARRRDIYLKAHNTHNRQTSMPPVGLEPAISAGWSLQHGHYSNPTAPNFQHTTNWEKKTEVVIQQHSRRILMMDILMSETCWVHKKWNKIASDFKLVFYSSTITMMHGPINIRFMAPFMRSCYINRGPLCWRIGCLFILTETKFNLPIRLLFSRFFWH